MHRIKSLIFHPLAVAVLLITMVSMATAEEVVVRVPPESLGNWYKPKNERQVWLHTMFGLREVLQAVQEYTAEGDMERAAKWSTRLRDLYLKIPKMVPEWSVEVEPEAAGALVKAASDGDTAAVGSALRDIGQTCNGCHVDYQAVAAARYRSPDYSFVVVEQGDDLVDYGEAMERLSRSLNRIKIALKDGEKKRAVAATEELESRLAGLGNSCSECHSDEPPRERILGHVPELMNDLRTALDGTDRREQGRLLGELGVSVCARCHGVHRTLADLRGEVVR